MFRIRICLHHQCSVSGLDLDSIRFVNSDLDPVGQNDPQNIEKNYEISCFEVLDVLFLGLKASPVAWTSFMEN